MKKALLFLQKNYRVVYILFIFSVCTLAILWVYPGQVKFKYDFQKGKPWQHDDLVAEFNFTKQKTQKQLADEKKKLTENKDLFFEVDANVAKNQLDALGLKWSAIAAQDVASSADSAIVWRVFSFIYLRGILEKTGDFDGDYRHDLYVIKSNKVSQFQPEDYFSQATATALLQDNLENEALVASLTSYLAPNVLFNSAKTEEVLKERIANIVTNFGYVKEGELVILKGAVVDEEKYIILSSLQSAYESNTVQETFPFQLLLGQLIYIVLLLGTLYFFIHFFRTSLLNYIANVNLILFSVFWMVFAAIVVIKFEADYLFIVPFPIVPIIMRAFYDTRIALFVHIVTILLVGYYVPNGFEFVVIQFVAGMSAIITVTGLYKRYQLFIAALKIISVYLIAYAAFILLHEGVFGDEQLVTMSYLVGSGFLSLFAFPLIFVYEKLFGQVSDLTLLELADTNSPLLRELATKSPGTFHHSIQVGNLAERAALTIEANTLLVRTGALYHDIGKMLNPMYFIENQVTGVNPHDDLSFEESAQIIINHVLDGVKLAKKHRLPEVIIDFIRTHHGTSRVEYFYRQYIKSFPEEEVKRKIFTYPGPLPYSKETAILMMADSVEAASRSLKEKSAENLNALIESIIQFQLAQGQFDNANITLKEIHEIKQVFKQQLANIYHVRIEYPEKIK